MIAPILWHFQKIPVGAREKNQLDDNFRGNFRGVTQGFANTGGEVIQLEGESA